MQRGDRLSQGWHDMRSALGLLTRLPLPPASRPPRGAEAAWAWPLAGLAVGGCGALAGGIALALGVPAGVAAALALGAQAMATGAMHEDGLGDTVDGLWGGWDKDRRLAIMKDSAIGSYGVMALLVVGLVRWSALATLLAAGDWPVLLAVGVLSRVPMVVMMARMPNARGSGLAQSIGRPSPQGTGLAILLGLGLALPLAGPVALAMVLPVLAVCMTLALVARAKIGGQTGDILGASQQLAEAAALTAAASLG